MSVRTSRCDSSVDSTVFFISKAFRIEPPAAREWSSGETEGTAMLLNKQLAGLRRCTRVRVWCDFFNCAKYSQLDSNVFRRLPRTVLFFSSFFFFLIFSSKGRSWGKTIFVDRFRHWIFRGFVCSDDVVAPAIGQAPTKSACFRVTAAPKCFWVCRNCTRLATLSARAGAGENIQKAYRESGRDRAGHSEGCRLHYEPADAGRSELPGGFTLGVPSRRGFQPPWTPISRDKDLRLVAFFRFDFRFFLLFLPTIPDSQITTRKQWYRPWLRNTSGDEICMCFYCFIRFYPLTAWTDETFFFYYFFPTIPDSEIITTTENSRIDLGLEIRYSIKC